MNVVQLTKDNAAEVIQRVISVLAQDGVIVYPTDTLYGLGANALSEFAVRRVFRIKQRTLDRALPVLVRDIFWAEHLAYVYEKEKKVLAACWPGTVTAVLKKRPIVPNVLTGDTNTIGMRVAASEFTDALLARFGYPITSTSANVSGDVPSFDADEIIAMFEKGNYKPDLIIDAGKLMPSLPSTVLDLSSAHPKILRVGATDPKTLLKLLEV
jgi:L-threonylcarbamoyladenylate synthase